MRYLKILIPVILFFLVSIQSRSAELNSFPITPNSLLSEIITLSPRAYSKASGEHLNAKERLAFRLLKSSMKKAIRKNPAITVGQFYESRRNKEVGGSFLFVLALIIVFGFIVFVITFDGPTE